MLQGGDALTSEPRPIRRVVTGNDEYGRSGVLFDSAAPNVNPGAISRGTCMTDIWVYQTAPAVISGARDDGNLPFHFEPPRGGRPSAHRAVERQTGRLRSGEGPGVQAARADAAASRRSMGSRRAELVLVAGAQIGDVDYGILLQGERTLLLDRGNVTMKAGDVVVQLGNWHGWTNVNERSLMAFVMMGATFAQEPKVEQKV